MSVSEFWSPYCNIYRRMASTTQVPNLPNLPNLSNLSMGPGLPTPPAEDVPSSTAQPEDAESLSSQALVTVNPPPSSDAEEEESIEEGLTGPMAALPVEVDISVPVRDFRVRNLLALEPGQVIESQWANGEDMPLHAREVQLAWTEFEVLDTELAVRITRLA
jgi:flagellar motor switch protein FliN/FliY